MKRITRMACLNSLICTPSAAQITSLERLTDSEAEALAVFAGTPARIQSHIKPDQNEWRLNAHAKAGRIAQLEGIELGRGGVNVSHVDE